MESKKSKASNNAVSKVYAKRPHISVYPGETDLRKGIYALEEICGKSRNSTTKKTRRLDFFVFCNKHKNRIKIFVKCSKCHLIHERHLDKGAYFWWPDTKEELKKNSKSIRKYVVEILIAYGFFADVTE